MFHHQKFGIKKYSIPNLGVSTTILNPVGIFRRWCNFGLIQGQIKSCHFSEPIEAMKKYICFLYTFLGIIGWKQNRTTLLDSDFLDSLLPFKWNWIRLAHE